MPVSCEQPQIRKRPFARHGSSVARISHFYSEECKIRLPCENQNAGFRIRKNVCVNKKDKPRAVRRKLRRQIEQQINADALRRQFGSELTGTVVTAVCNIKYADKLFIKGAAITQEHREQISRLISQESMERFLNSVTIDFGRIENPVAYLQTSLYTYHQKLLQPSQAEPVSTGTPEQPLADWELAWLDRVKAKRHSQETE